ncbi:hypothetical protein BH10PSE5_BH10PSE5_21740 [soil metagenome]
MGLVDLIVTVVLGGQVWVTAPALPQGIVGLVRAVVEVLSAV